MAAALLAAGATAVFPVHDFDVWWHLRTGRWIVENRSIPRHDIFTYTAGGRPWVAHEWLAEVLFHLVYRASGSDGLILMKTAVLLGAAGLAAAAALAGPDGRRRLPATALAVLLAAPPLAIRAFERPHIFTALFLAATLLLLRLESARGRLLWRWLLCPLVGVWANLHSGFVLGLALAGLYWAGEALSPRIGGARPPVQPAWRGRLAALAAAGLAGLVNPNHVEAFLYPFRLLARPEVRSMIAELQPVTSPVFAGALFLEALAGLALWLAVSLVFERRRLQWSLLLPGAVFALLAWRSVRSVSELAVLAPAVVGAHGGWLARRRGPALAAAVAVLVGSAGLIGLHLRTGLPLGSREPPRRFGLGVHPVNAPEGAARFLEAVRPAGRIFAVLAFGDYFIFRLWPEYEVYIDGRLDVFSPEFLSHYAAMMETGTGWDETVARHGITIAVLDYPPPGRVDLGLHGRLRADPAWRTVFAGDNALIYARDVAGNRALLERYGMVFDPATRTPDAVAEFARRASPEDLGQTLAALAAMQTLDPQGSVAAYLEGRMLDLAGRSEAAIEPLRRSLARDPASPIAGLALAEALLHAGRIEAAREQLGPLQAAHPDWFELLLVRADLERFAGRPAAAAAALEQAAGQQPGNPVVPLRLGVIQAESGDLGRARASFERALRLSPGNPAALANLERLRGLERSRP